MLLQRIQHSDELVCIYRQRVQLCVLSRHGKRMGKRAGNGRPFSVIIVERPGDINTTGGPGDIWEVITELYPFVYTCVSACRASVFDIPDMKIEFVGFRKHGCAFSSSHLGLPYTLVTNKINVI